MVGYNMEVLYLKTRYRGWLGQGWSALSGRSRRLIPLSEVEARCTVRDRHNAGRRTVSIEHIRGSEGRCTDFDCDFSPVQDHSQDRWLRVARAWQEDKPLPPIELVQVGDVYFVLDGHHRLSVALALGQRAIEAEVTVWRVDGPLPWGGATAVSGQGQSGQRDGALRGRARRLGERVLLSLHGLVPAWMGSNGYAAS